MDTKSKKPRLALVIGGGGIKCATGLGVWQALTNAGIDIDMVVGCSAGSIFSSFIGVGFSVEEGIDIFNNLWTKDLFGRYKIRALMQIVFPKLFGFNNDFGIMDESKIFHHLAMTFKDMTFEETKVPLYIVATDYQTGQSVTISKGKILHAIRASLAIPGIFSPYEIDGKLLFDGAVADPMPIDVAIREGADIILGIGFQTHLHEEPKSPAGYIGKVFTDMTNNLLVSKFAFHNLAHHSEIIPMVPEFEEEIHLYDTEKIPFIISEGKKLAEGEIDYLKKLLAKEGV